MIKGTNPTITLKISNSYPIRDFDDLQFTMDQDVRLTKYLKDMNIDEMSNQVSFKMTLEEMNGFTANKTVKTELRIKLKNGDYIKSKIKKVNVLPAIEEGRF